MNAGTNLSDLFIDLSDDVDFCVFSVHAADSNAKLIRFPQCPFPAGLLFSPTSSWGIKTNSVSVPAVLVSESAV